MSIHSISRSFTLTLIEEFIYSSSIQNSSHPSSSLIQTLSLTGYLQTNDQYLECVSMWDSRLRVVKGKHRIKFY